MDEKLKKYPKTESFEVIDSIGVPHPYCITPKHVAWAADHCCGMLSKEAIIEAEAHGARCDICKGKLKYDEHQQALLVECKKDIHTDVNAKEELKEYLLSIKTMAEEDKYAGFAFKKAF